MADFSPVEGMKFKKQTKMVEHKLVSFAAAVALWTPVTLLIKLTGKLLKWKYIQDKNYAIFALRCKREAILSKSFVPVTPRAVIFIWESFHPGYRDLGNRASPASHMITSKFLRRKE